VRGGGKKNTKKLGEKAIVIRAIPGGPQKQGKPCCRKRRWTKKNSSWRGGKKGSTTQGGVDKLRPPKNEPRGKEGGDFPRLLDKRTR